MLNKNEVNMAGSVTVPCFCAGFKQLICEYRYKHSQQSLSHGGKVPCVIDTNMDLFLSSQGKVRPQAENDCVQHLSNQLRRHRRHRQITSSQQHRAALRRIRQLQQTVDIFFD